MSGHHRRVSIGQSLAGLAVAGLVIGVVFAAICGLGVYLLR